MAYGSSERVYMEIRFTSLITVGKGEGQVMMSAETSLPLTGIILEQAFR